MGNGANRARPTMRQVAERAGVHKSTVSRVLSGKPSGASPRTAEAVRAAARDLGYLVDHWAASLRTQRTHTIGVLLPRLTDSVLAMLFEAVDALATHAGYEVLVASTGDDPAEQRRRVRLLESRRVDGLIVTTARLGEESYFDELRRRGVPFVLANRALPGHPFVRGDDHRGGLLATRHLIAAGHRRIGCIAGGAYAPTAADRLRGYRDALAEAGVDFDGRFVVESGPGVADGVRGARRLLGLHDLPTAILAVNDLVAVGAMAAIRDAGMRLGSDVAVVGYNDLPLSACLPVPLTSVRHPVDEIGRLAVRQLFDLLDGKQSEPVTLPVRLNVRESSQPSSKEPP